MGRGFLAWMRRRWTGPMAVSERWLQANAQKESQAGVDLPRWRFPAERQAIAHRARLAQLHLAKPAQRFRKRA